MGEGAWDRTDGWEGASAQRVSGWRSSGTQPTLGGLLQREKPEHSSHSDRPQAVAGGPVSRPQGCSRLVAGVPGSEEQGLATEAGPHPACRHHVYLAVRGP